MTTQHNGPGKSPSRFRRTRPDRPERSGRSGPSRRPRQPAAAGSGRTGDGAATEPPAPEPLPSAGPPLSGVRARAAAAGALAARHRQYDEWSFTTTIVFLEGLCAQRDQAVAANAADACAGAQQIRETMLRQRQAERAAAELAKATVEQARRDRDQARLRERIALDELEVSTGSWAPRERLGRDDDLADDGFRGPGTVRTSHRMRWMGAAGGRATAMPTPAWLTMGILVALVLLESTTCFLSLQRLHSHDDAVSIALAALTCPIALVMVLAPHRVGRHFRRRPALPSERFVAYAMVATIMLLWFVSVVLFGWFRQAVPLAREADPETGESVGGLAGPDPNWETMSVVFAVVLLLSGLIALLLGVAEDHPAIASYRAAASDRQAKEEAYLRAVGERAQTIESAVVPLDEQLEAHWQAAEERERAIWEEHQAAQCDYLDAVALGMCQPTLTEATAAAVRRQEPPDPPLVRLARARCDADPTTA
jgi:hypothetical protein